MRTQWLISRAHFAAAFAQAESLRSPSTFPATVLSPPTHVSVAVIDADLASLRASALQPFAAAIDAGVAAVMAGHLLVPAVDDLPASVSRRWLTDILRRRLGFEGLIFSDDLSMAGAGGPGDIVERAQAAHEAGCDMVLVCNDPAAADTLLSHWKCTATPELARRAQALAGRDSAAAV